MRMIVIMMIMPSESASGEVQQQHFRGVSVSSWGSPRGGAGSLPESTWTRRLSVAKPSQEAEPRCHRLAKRNKMDLRLAA